MKYIALILYLIFSTAVAEAKVSPTLKESCGLRAYIVKILREKHKERQVAIGLDIHNRIVEVFASDVGEFTILLSYPSGYSCIATLGNGWEMDSVKSKGESF
jgi:hypothetical protein|tara:strand:+ start:286 stop:591 length:306 start_codon:yes stop_codon:yes gene_type:complete